MKLDRNSMVLYAITGRTWLGDKKLSEVVEQAILGGATFVQLREKNVSYDEFVQLAREVKSVTDKYNVPFVINDNVEVALRVDADGVHIGQGDGSVKSARDMLGRHKIIGVSAKNAHAAVSAQLEGADYIGAGSVFSTSTKLDAENINLDILKEITSSVSIPVVAIGGINKGNVLNLSGCGIDGICAISAIFGQEDVREAASELFKLSEQTIGGY
ncbi:thiamine phosphate synthase [Sedimentibacter sp. B4]|uniref:thiamine phosphate synthase n=1 Tax=Sedimentibacter sp. B4 TaxID=304766 RepID=UPI0003160121|nr:thiamine phosphate synthase [Sedimentibacter sp. B4]